MYVNKPHIEEHKNFIKFKARTEPTKYLVVHCSATQNKKDFDWKTIDQMHRQRGFLAIGYHFVIKTDGTIQKGRDLEAIGAHAKGYNSCSVGICLIGGVDAKGKSVDNFTDKQKESLKELLDYLYYLYKDCIVVGHRDLPNVHKDCPCFDVKKFYKNPPKYVVYDGSPIEEISNLSKSDLELLNGTLDFQKGSVIRIK